MHSTLSRFLIILLMLVTMGLGNLGCLVQKDHPQILLTTLLAPCTSLDIWMDESSEEYQTQ